MANGIKKEIQGTRFSFKDATAPRNKASIASTAGPNR